MVQREFQTSDFCLMLVGGEKSNIKFIRSRFPTLAEVYHMRVEGERKILNLINHILSIRRTHK